MKTVLVISIALFILAGPVSAKTVEHEVSKNEASKRGWNISSTRGIQATSFKIEIPFKDSVLPEGTYATLSMRDGNQVINYNRLILQNDGKKTFFTFTVADDLLEKLRFSLCRIDIPHPSMSVYWIDLSKFITEKTEKVPCEIKDEKKTEMVFVYLGFISLIILVSIGAYYFGKNRGCKVVRSSNKQS